VALDGNQRYDMVIGGYWVEGEPDGEPGAWEVAATHEAPLMLPWTERTRVLERAVSDSPAADPAAFGRSRRGARAGYSGAPGPSRGAGPCRSSGCRPPCPRRSSRS